MTRRGVGEGTIRQRKDRTYEARLVVDGERKSVYAKTRREVQQKLSAARRSAHIQHCYAELLTSGLSARSVEQAHTVLRCALRHAV